jgi:hypothetical protein
VISEKEAMKFNSTPSPWQMARERKAQDIILNDE